MTAMKLTNEQVSEQCAEASNRYAAMSPRERDLRFAYELSGWISACNNAGITLSESFRRINDLLDRIKNATRRHGDLDNEATWTQRTMVSFGASRT
jgi:hypothetical protein